MQSTLRSILSMLLLFAAHASPLPSRFTRGLPGAVYACPLPNWSGECIWRQQGYVPDYPCLNEESQIIPTGFTFGSIGPDQFGGCVLYGSSECGSSDPNTKIGFLVWPGNSTVVAGVQSMWCYACNAFDCSDIKNPFELVDHRHPPHPPRST